jgi:CelD/BcsL family acetyltransferase involved in cellulose biosynthesis
MPPPEVRAAPAAIRARVVTSASALRALADDWHALWLRCSTATPFTTPAWLMAWWEHLGAGELRVIALRDAGRLVALAPLQLAPDGTLQLLGTGVSDYGDALVEPGREPDCARAFAEFVSASRDVRRLDLRQLRSGSPLLTSALVEPDVPCPVVPLAETRERRLPARFRHELDYERRRLARVGSVSFETADTHSLDDFLAALFALHAARWADDGGGVLAEERVRAFHRDAARALLADGLLRLHALRVGGEIVGIYHGFHAADRAYYYLGGFAPAWQRYGVGNQLIDFAQQCAASEGAAAFDFLRGQESYKYRWGARDEPTWRVQRETTHR